MEVTLSKAVLAKLTSTVLQRSDLSSAYSIIDVTVQKHC